MQMQSHDIRGQWWHHGVHETFCCMHSCLGLSQGKKKKQKEMCFKTCLFFLFPFPVWRFGEQKQKRKEGSAANNWRNDVQTFAFACWLLKCFLLSQWSPKTLFIFTHDCLLTWLLCKVWTVSKQKHWKSHGRSSTKRSLVKQGKAVLTDVSFDHEILQSLHLAPMTTFDIQIVHRISNKTQKTEHLTTTTLEEFTVLMSNNCCNWIWHSVLLRISRRC